MKKTYLFIAVTCCAMMVNAAGLGTSITVCDSLHTNYADGRKYKVEYTYNNAGQEIKSISSQWETDKWVPYFKTESAYSPTGKIKEATNYLWNTTADDWKPGKQELTTYDAKDSITSYTESYWNESKNYFEPEDRVEYFYNGNGQLVKEQVYYWNSTSEALESFSRTEYTYDAEGRLKTEILDYYYSGWYHSDSTVNIYDTKGRLAEINKYKWNSGVWEESKHSECYYTGHNDLSTKTTWQKYSGAWVPTKYHEYSYDSQYRLTGRDEYDWDSSTTPGSWKIFYKNERTYDAKGNQTSIIEYRTKSDVLTEDTKIEYTYDDDNNMLTNTNYSWKSGAWELYCVQERFYSPLIVTSCEQIKGLDRNIQTKKIIRNGVMYILRDDEVYSIHGVKL